MTYIGTISKLVDFAHLVWGISCILFLGFSPLQYSPPRRGLGTRMRKESAGGRSASCRRQRWLDRKVPSVRLQAVNGDHFFPLAHLQLEDLWSGREDLVRAAVEWRQGGDCAAFADVNVRRRHQYRWRFGCHLCVGDGPRRRRWTGLSQFGHKICRRRLYPVQDLARKDKGGAEHELSRRYMPVSLVGAARRPMRTHGRWRGQSGPARRARRASFNRRWHRSTMQFA